MKNKIIKHVTLALLSVLVLAGCGNKPAPSDESSDSETPTDVISEEPSSEEPSSEEPSSEEPSSEEPSSEEPSSEEPSSEVPAKDDLSFTLPDLSKVYDGMPVDPGFESFELNGVTIDPVCSYKRKYETSDKYTYVAPIDAGTYTLRVQVAENEKFNAYIDSKEFTISQRQLTFDIPDTWELRENSTNVFNVYFNEANGVAPGDHAIGVELSLYDAVTDEEITKPGEYTGVHVSYEFFGGKANYIFPTNLPDTINVRLYDKHDFLAYVEDVYVKNGGVIVTTTVTHGIIHYGDYVYLEGDGTTTTVIKIEKGLGKEVMSAMQGENVAIYLLNADSTKIHRGDALLSPALGDNEFQSHASFTATLHLYSPDEGGGTDSITTDFAGFLFFGNIHEQVTISDFFDATTNASLTQIMPGQTVRLTITFVNGARVMARDILYELKNEAQTSVIGYLVSVDI